MLEEGMAAGWSGGQNTGHGDGAYNDQRQEEMYGGGMPLDYYVSGNYENADASYGEGSAQTDFAPAGAAPRYQKAAPEDLQKVRSAWKSIVSATSGMFRVVLSAAEPKFNSQNADDGRLFVVFADFLAERYLTNQDRKAELEQIIAEKTGRQVEVKFVLAADESIQKGSLSKIEIDERIHEFIHTDIEIED
jgi:DNA polymerase-3 subunit gamma/tau